MKGELLHALPKFHSWGKCTMPLTNVNSDWMSNASSGLCIILGYISYLSSKVTAPQDAHGRLVLLVYLGSNTSELSDIVCKIFVSRL